MKTEPHISRRAWLFRLLAVPAGPAVFLLCLELTLRLAGIGFNPSATIPYKSGQTTYYVDNPRYSWQFFPPALARQFEPFRISQQRYPGTYRIIVLGESAVQGIPDGAYAFTRILALMLEAAYPNVRFELINAGMTAINSHVIYQIAKDMIIHRPDMIVVYAGHNEVIGPFGPGTVFSAYRSRLWLIRLGIALGKTRIGQLIRMAIAARQVHILQSWGGMGMFLDKQIHPTDPALEVVYKHFRRNILDICRMAAKAGAVVVLCTPASNIRDCPPFASLHRPDLGPSAIEHLQQAFERGKSQEAAGQYESALSDYERALAIDDQYAELQYRMARCLDALGRPQQSYQHYQKARDTDALRFRADTRLCQVIRELAALHLDGVYLADTEKASQQSSPPGGPGKELFYEHVHPNFSGNWLIARTICQTILEHLQGQFGQPDTAAIPSEQACQEALAFTPLDRYILANRIYQEFLTRPPFTNQPYHNQILVDWQARLKALEQQASNQMAGDSIQIYHKAIEARPTDWYLHWKLGMILADRLHDPQAAQVPFRQVQGLMPAWFLAYTAMGQVYLRMDMFDRAISEFRQALSRYDAHATTHFLLAHAYQAQKDLEKAVNHFRMAAYWQPNELIYYTSWAKALMQLGKQEQAQAVLRKARQKGL